MEPDVDFSEEVDEGRGPKVQCQSRLRFRRPATGVSGHESLSESEESRLSPVRGTFGRGEVSSEAKAVVEGFSAGDVLVEAEGVESESESEALDVDEEEEESVLEVGFASTEDRVEVEPLDSMSEWAKVNLTVLISSSSGVRKETFFSAGKRGRAEAIFRGMMSRAGLLDSMETRLCGCL